MKQAGRKRKMWVLVPISFGNGRLMGSAVFCDVSVSRGKRRGARAAGRMIDRDNVSRVLEGRGRIRHTSGEGGCAVEPREMTGTCEIAGRLVRFMRQRSRLFW